MDGNSFQGGKSDSNVDVDVWISELSTIIEGNAGNIGAEDMTMHLLSCNDDNGSQMNKVIVNLEEKLKQDVPSSYDNTISHISKVGAELDEKLCEDLPSSVDNNVSWSNKVTTKLEEKSYQEAIAKTDFLSSLCQKMMPMESSAGCSLFEGVESSSSLHNMAVLSQDSDDNVVGHGVQSSALSNTHKEFSRSQSFQQMAIHPHQQQLQHQLLKQKATQTNVQSSFMQSHNEYNHKKQQQKFPLAQLQSSHHSLFAAMPDNWTIGQLQNASAFQQKSQSRQESNVSENQVQLPLFQQNMSTSFQKPLWQQSNISGTRQQQQTIVLQSDRLKMQTRQHPLHFFLQSEVSAPQANFQQSMQLNQIPGTQTSTNLLQDCMQQRHPMSATWLHPQSIMVGDQQKPQEQLQKEFPEASSGSSTQAGLANPADWCDLAYQQLQSIKETYLPELIKFYRRLPEMCLWLRNAESGAKFEKMSNLVKKLIKFLQMPKTDMMLSTKDNVYCQLKFATYYLKQFKIKPVSGQHFDQVQQPGSEYKTPQVQQNGNTTFQLNSLNPAALKNTSSFSSQFMTQQGVLNSQASMINSLQNVSLTRSDTGYAPSSLQYGLLKPTQHYDVSRPQQTNMMNSLHNYSQVGLEHRTLDSLRHASAKSIYQNTMSISQQTISSPRTPVNALDAYMGSFPPISAMTPLTHMNQQLKQKMLQAQKMKQPIQAEQNKQQMLMQKINEFNDAKVGQMTFSPRILQQHDSIVHCAEYSPQALLQSTPCQLQDTTQNSQHSSPQVDSKNLLSPLSRAGRPLQCGALSFVVHSPSSPITPSLPVDPEKLSSGAYPISMPEKAELPIISSQLQSQIKMHDQFLVVDSPGISASPLLTEFSAPEASHESDDTQEPFKHFIEMVKSASPKTLNASVWEIGSIINMAERITQTTPLGDSVEAIDAGLVDNTRYQEEKFSLHCGTTLAKRMKRHVNVLSLDASSYTSKIGSLECLSCQTSDVESTASSKVKKLKVEHNRMLLQEIKEINLQLVETVLEVDRDFIGEVTVGAYEGTVVVCSYSAIAVNENLKLEYASAQMSPSLLVRLLVPVNYPNSSPVILDTSPVGFSAQNGDLLEKAKLRFSLSLRKLSEPMLLGDMAKTWDSCARAVFFEFAERIGGKCFSSRYGMWESCITAA